VVLQILGRTVRREDSGTKQPVTDWEIHDGLAAEPPAPWIPFELRQLIRDRRVIAP